MISGITNVWEHAILLKIMLNMVNSQIFESELFITDKPTFCHSLHFFFFFVYLVKKFSFLGYIKMKDFLLRFPWDVSSPLKFKSIWMVYYNVLMHLKRNFSLQYERKSLRDGKGLLVCGNERGFLTVKRRRKVVL